MIQKIPIPRVSDTKTEKAVIGRVIDYAKDYAQVADRFHAGLFTTPQLARIAEAIIYMRGRGHRPDLLNIGDYCEQKYGMVRRDVALLVDECQTEATFCYDVEPSLLILTEKAIRNNLYALGHRLLFDNQMDALQLLVYATERVSEADSNIHGDTLRPISDVMLEVSADMDAAVNAFRNQETPPNVISTGFAELDRMFAGGWAASDFVVLAARPGMGKTALALNILRNIGKDKPCIMFSLEMSAAQLGQRVVSSEAEINGMAIKQGSLTDTQINHFTSAASTIAGLDAYIDDRANKLNQIIGISKRWRLQTGMKKVGLIVVDYLQLIDSEVKGKTTNDQTAAISRRLKLLAKELNCVVLCLSQLNRSVETRGGDKRPMLSDLRDSGAIEQDADSVLFLYRPEYYGFETDAEGNSSAGVAELIISKNRHGATGVINMNFVSKYGRFRDASEVLTQTALQNFTPLSDLAEEQPPF